MEPAPLNTPSPAGRSRLRPLAVRLLRGAVLVYLGLCLGAYFGQDWIAFPGARFQGKPETAIRFGAGVEILHLRTAGGIPLAAIFGRAKHPDGTDDPRAGRRPTVLYFYGNGGSIAWSQGEFDHFRRLGCNVLIPDLPGFGQSGGKPSEKNFYAAADAAWEFLRSRPDVDGHQIVVAGWSMGGAVATDLASRKPVAALLVFNAFTTFPAIAGQLLPWLPTPWLAKYSFDNAGKIAAVRVPIFIANGGLDTLVPAWMSDTLAARPAGPVTRLTIATADHNSIFTADPGTLWPAVAAFLRPITPRP